MLVSCPLVHLFVYSPVLPCAWSPSQVRFCSPMDYSPPGSSVHGVSQQEYWIGVPFPTQEDFPNLGTKPLSPESPPLAD